jgi:hypothetical protein
MHENVTGGLFRFSVFFGIEELLWVNNPRWFAWAGTREDYFDKDFSEFFYVGC